MEPETPPASNGDRLKHLLERVAVGELTPAEALQSLEELPADTLSSAKRAFSSGEFAQARKLFERSINEARLTSDGDTLADAFFGMGRALNTIDGSSGAALICDAFDLYLGSGRIKEAINAATEQGGFPYTRRMLEMLHVAKDHAREGTAEHASVISRLAIVQGVLVGTSRDNDELLGRAIESAEQHGDHRTLTLSWKRKAMLSFQNLRFPIAMEESIVATAYAMLTEDPEMICRGAENAGRIALVLGQQDVAETYIRLYRDAACELKQTEDIFDSTHLAAELAVAKGQFGAARSMLQELLGIEDLSEKHRRTATTLDALLAAETGDLEYASKVIDQVASREMVSDSRTNIGLLLMLRGHAPDLGVLDEALGNALKSRVDSWLGPKGVPAFYNLAVFAEYSYSFVTGDASLARRALKREMRGRDGVVTAARMWHSSHYRALGFAAANEWRSAEAEFEAALVSCRSAGNLQPLVWTIVHFGKMALRSGRRAQLRRSTALIAEARPIAAGLGMAIASRRLTEIHRAIAPRGRQVMGLTDRERQVLQLLIAGKKNAEIAAELVLSSNTIASHIKSIYTKLGVSNRAEAVTAGNAAIGSRHEA